MENNLAQSILQSISPYFKTKIAFTWNRNDTFSVQNERGKGKKSKKSVVANQQK